MCISEIVPLIHLMILLEASHIDVHSLSRLLGDQEKINIRQNWKISLSNEALNRVIMIIL